MVPPSRSYVGCFRWDMRRSEYCHEYIVLYLGVLGCDGLDLCRLASLYP